MLEEIFHLPLLVNRRTWSLFAAGSHLTTMRGGSRMEREKIRCFKTCLSLINLTAYLTLNLFGEIIHFLPMSASVSWVFCYLTEILYPKWDNISKVFQKCRFLFLVLYCVDVVSMCLVCLSSNPALPAAAWTANWRGTRAYTSREGSQVRSFVNKRQCWLWAIAINTDKWKN